MTAMSQARQPVEVEGLRSTAPVKGATTILQGALVVAENGLAVPGKTATGLTILGVSEETVKNTGADGTKKVPFRRGTFGFANHAADALAAGDIGKTAYVVDDQTVAKTDGTGTRSAAGKIMHIEGGQIFVRVGY
ncbi:MULTISPECIES: hypothetical protein [unclassified Rhizobium]|uniref:hypothetical protein n=1 Tax=unclassified Rhizobium TaxID=2613769 RepID=UPI0024787F41|nr:MULTISPECIES: hypothetical protein [unclassified Rhizobium]MDH7802245.1 hypothetical protein [Rhizobium sp. AN70]